MVWSDLLGFVWVAGSDTEHDEDDESADGDAAD